MDLPASTLPRTAKPRTLASGFEHLLDRALAGQELSREEAYRLIRCTPEEAEALYQAAAILRDRGHGTTVTFSPKVFLPLTQLCRDFCDYCAFRQDPGQASRLYMTPKEVLEVARAAERLGCTEALFTLGERPGQRYLEAREWLAKRGYQSTLEYLRDMCALVLEETSLLPHANPGTMSRYELAMLKEVNASMGLMLESISERLTAPGGPHELAPSKRPRVRLRTTELAGTLRIPFTSGILIGIGETLEERVDSLLAIRELHRRYGHIQEVIIQNFRSKPTTPMGGHPEPSTDDVMRTVATARLILGPQVNIQVPPNLSARDYPRYLLAGINDWGGISPLTIDYVNPEAPWPQISTLRRHTEELGFQLRPRLAVYPEYVTTHVEYLPPSLKQRIQDSADSEGYVKGGISRYESAK
ncbi:MAG: 7,8-didemethyl-8-hydroxy-5-deazariboflavin synthase CofG [Dehalococcoidia bacterium]